MPLLIVLIGVIILIFMIVKLKMNTFVGLVITSFVVGLLLGLPLTKIPQTIETGIGGQLGHLAIIFGFGSMLLQFDIHHRHQKLIYQALTRNQR